MLIISSLLYVATVLYGMQKKLRNRSNCIIQSTKGSLFSYKATEILNNRAILKWLNAVCYEGQIEVAQSAVEMISSAFIEIKQN